MRFLALVFLARPRNRLIGHTEYSETRIEQLDHIFNLIGIIPIGLNIGQFYPISATK